MSVQAHLPSSGTFRTWQWWILIAVSIVAFLGGCWGFYEYDVAEIKRHHLGHSEHPAEPAGWVAAYHSLQLFALHAPHLDPTITVTPLAWWGLLVGRWGAALVFFSIVLKVMLSVLQKNVWHAAKLRWWPHHVLICGLGALGLPLAVQATKRGWKPVAIERDPLAEGVRVAREHGIPVVVGDATDPTVLLRARVDRVERVFAVCAQDDVNVGIAALAGRVGSPAASPGKRECWVFVGDPRLRAGLQEQKAFLEQDNYRVTFRRLDIHAVRARRALADNPLDHLHISAESKKQARLVIVGFGEMGQSLALQAAQIGHFANGEKLRITIVDDHAAKLMVSFETRYRMFRQLCDLEVVNGGLDDPAVLKRVAGECRSAEDSGDPVTITVCHDGRDAFNVVLALELAEALPGSRSPVLVYLAATSGFEQLIPSDGSHVLESRLRRFGMLEEIWTLETLIDEWQDKRARAFHEDYREHLSRADGGRPVARRPADVPWDELADTFKDANRALADHLPIKLRAFGLHIEPLPQPGRSPVTELALEEIKVLARMEHARWCAERWLAGWSHGEKRDDANKRHPDLCPWSELPAREAQIDVHLMSNISRVLERSEEGVFR